ncbi:TPA: hypothetical protein ACH3X2_003634 [Trebouxia sp. C0005]
MEREALHKAAIKFSLDLHPSATADVMEGVRDQLNAVLLRYSTYLEGVLISYTQPRIISQQARIHPYFPYFHVDVLADCVLFKPAAGHILDGKVHMVSHDFIGLLVLGLFNVSIGRQHIRADLNYDVIGDCWQSQRHEDHRIAIGTALRFKVDKVDDESEFFTLAGSLLAPGTGDVTYLSQQAKKTNKKRRHSEAAATDAPATAAAAPTGTATAAAAAKTPVAAASIPPVSAQAAKPSAAKAAAKASLTKADKKAAKAAAKAAEKEHAKTAATAAAAAAAAPNSGDGRAEASRDGPGNGAHTLFPKKKKRQKHQDTSSQAGPSTEAPAAPASNAQHRTAANSPAVNGLAHGAAAHSPAVAQAAATSAPTADQNAAIGPLTQQPAAVLQNGAADAQQDGKNVKQKAHKKKKREIDKPAASPVTASAHPEPSHTISQEPVPNINAAAAPSEPGSAPSGSSKKHKKHKEKKGSKQR